MNMTVPQSVVDSADRCEHNHSCLTERRCGPHEMCDVSEADGRNILFLCAGKDVVCSYRIPFGNGHICRCPVHYWLHTNHQK